MDHSTTQIQPYVNSEDLKCLKSLGVRPPSRTKFSWSKKYMNKEDPPSEERILQRSGSTGGLPSYDDALHMLQSSQQLEKPVVESTWIISFGSYVLRLVHLLKTIASSLRILIGLSMPS